MYQKTNAESEIKRVGKDSFWAKAEVSAVVVEAGTLTDTLLGIVLTAGYTEGTVHDGLHCSFFDMAL